jgi:hypothetical protein
MRGPVNVKREIHQDGAKSAKRGDDPPRCLLTATATLTDGNADELAAVTGSGSESYGYDSDGNRTGTGYSKTIVNEVTTSQIYIYI